MFAQVALLGVVDVLQRREGDLAILGVLDGFHFLAVLIQQDEAELAFLQLPAFQLLRADEVHLALCLVGIREVQGLGIVRSHHFQGTVAVVGHGHLDLIGLGVHRDALASLAGFLHRVGVLAQVGLLDVVDVLDRRIRNLSGGVVLHRPGLGSIAHLKGEDVILGHIAAIDGLAALEGDLALRFVGVGEDSFICIHFIGRSQVAVHILHQCDGDVVRLRVVGIASRAAIDLAHGVGQRLGAGAICSLGHISHVTQVVDQCREADAAIGGILRFRHHSVLSILDLEGKLVNCQLAAFQGLGRFQLNLCTGVAVDDGEALFRCAHNGRHIGVLFALVIGYGLGHAVLDLHSLAVLLLEHRQLLPFHGQSVVLCIGRDDLALHQLLRTADDLLVQAHGDVAAGVSVRFITLPLLGGSNLGLVAVGILEGQPRLRDALRLHLQRAVAIITDGQGDLIAGLVVGHARCPGILLGNGIGLPAHILLGEFQRLEGKVAIRIVRGAFQHIAFAVVQLEGELAFLQRLALQGLHAVKDIFALGVVGIGELRLSGLVCPNLAACAGVLLGEPALGRFQHAIAGAVRQALDGHRFAALKLQRAGAVGHRQRLAIVHGVLAAEQLTQGIGQAQGEGELLLRVGRIAADNGFADAQRAGLDRVGDGVVAVRVGDGGSQAAFALLVLHDHGHVDHFVAVFDSVIGALDLADGIGVGPLLIERQLSEASQLLILIH